MDTDKQQFIYVRTSKKKVDDLVTLNVGNFKFLCSKKKLSQRSPYFRAMFNSNFIERDQDSVTIHDIDGEALKFILTKLPKQLKSVKDPLKVLQVASILLFESFLHGCENYILSTIKDRSLPIMCVSKMLNNNVLYNKARAISLWNFKELKTSEDLYKMKFQDFFEYVNDCDLNSPEEFEVFECITEWLNYSLDCRIHHTYDLIKTVRFKLLEPIHVSLMLLVPIIVANEEVRSLLNVILELLKMKSMDTLDFCKAIEPFNYAPQLECQLLQTIKDVMITTRPSPLMPCTICEFDGAIPCVVGFDGEKLNCFWKIPKLQSKGFFLNGFRVISIGFKVYFIGGEYGYGYGKFNLEVWSYDTMDKKWTFEGMTAYPRRHFFVCVIENDIFMIGGTGLHRVILNKISKFNVITGKSEDCGKFKNGKIEAVCSDKNLIYIATGEYVWCFNPNNEVCKTMTSIPRGKIISFMNVSNGWLYFVDRSDKSVWRLNWYSPSLHYEFIAKFNFHGDALMIDRFVYCFSHGDNSCFMEQLSVDSNEVKAISGNVGFRTTHTNNCRGTTCFSYSYYS